MTSTEPAASPRVTPSRTGRAKVGAIDLAFDVFDGGPRRMVLVMGIGYLGGTGAVRRADRA